MTTSPRKRRQLNSVIVPSVQSPPSKLKLHDFCNRAGAVTLDALMMIVIDIGCQRGQRDIVDHFPVRSQGRLTERVVGERPDRSEERRVGKECVSTCRSRWLTYN